MSLTLHFGVVEQPYRSWVTNAKGRRVRGSPTPTSTYDVAKILEEKYGLMKAFYRAHQDDVVKALEGSLGKALEALVLKRTIDPWGPAMQDIQSQFNEFISSQEAERVGIPGTPTKAAMRGVNHRLRHPYAKRNPRRPSFRDTGMYMNSFRAWVS